MIYFALIVSLLHLVWMNWLVFRKTSATFLYLGALVPIVPLFVCMIISPAAFIGFLVTAVLAGMCRNFAPDRPGGFFLASSLAALVLIYGGFAWQTLARQRDLQARSPLESMAERVPVPKPGLPLREVAETAEWQSLEAKLSEEEKQYPNYARAENLQRLHEETMRNFVSSPGFGSGRMKSGPREDRYTPREPIAQPEAIPPLVLSTEMLEKSFAGERMNDLKQLHFNGLTDFINVEGFGYVKDRQNVAGFRSHQFSKLPEAPQLNVKRLELIGLVMHEKPRAYVSETLPRMSELVKAPTRALNDFEIAGLEGLQKGEDLFVREIDATLYMLGAIRSVKQCVTCHGGERGDLLGAFSYSLTRSPAGDR